MHLDTTAWDRAFDEYKQFHKRSLSQIINKKIWYISLWALQLTKAADKSVVQMKLKAPARDYPKAPLAGILVNIERRKKTLKGLTGAAMAKAIDKKLAKARSSVNFLRSGWIPAKDAIGAYIRAKGDWIEATRKAPKDVTRSQGVVSKGHNKGRGIPAIINRERVFAEIENNIRGTNPGPKVTQVLMEGLQKAVNKEISKMREDIERHYNPATEKLNR